MCTTSPGTHHLSSLPRDTQQWPSQPGRNSSNGTLAAAASWGVDSRRNRGRNKTKRSWKENIIPAVSERARRLQVLSCLQEHEGQLRPRLADARYLTRSRGAAWQGGHLVPWVPTQLFQRGQKPFHLRPFLFLPLLPLPPSTSPTARGPHASSPRNPPLAGSYFQERQEVFLVLLAPGRNSEPLSRSSAGARETAAALADISCIIKLNPSRGLGLGHQLSKERKERSQRARG